MRLIDAESLKHNIDKYNYSYFGANYDKILEVIDSEPTVKAKQTTLKVELKDKEIQKIEDDVIKHFEKRGYWKPINTDNNGLTNLFECSKCKAIIQSPYWTSIDFGFLYTYCPICGAIMHSQGTKEKK